MTTDGLSPRMNRRVFSAHASVKAVRACGADEKLKVDRPGILPVSSYI